MKTILIIEVKNCSKKNFYEESKMSIFQKTELEKSQFLQLFFDCRDEEGEGSDDEGGDGDEEYSNSRSDDEEEEYY